MSDAARHDNGVISGKGVQPSARPGFFLKRPVLSMVLSALFTYLPVLCNISSGFRIIVITLITAGGAALLFPIPDEPAEPEKEMPHEG